MELPLNRELERRLLTLSVLQRKVVLVRAKYYIHDRAFLNHISRMDVSSTESIRFHCTVLHEFNTQPGVRQELDRLFADVAAHGLFVNGCR